VFSDSLKIHIEGVSIHIFSHLRPSSKTGGCEHHGEGECEQDGCEDAFHTESLDRMVWNEQENRVWARVVDRKMDSGELVADQQVLNELLIRDLLIRYEETVSPSKRRAKVESDKIDLLLCHSLRSSVFLFYDQVQTFNIGL